MVASDDYDIIVKQPTRAEDAPGSNKSSDVSSLYFAEKDLSRILNNLDELRSEVYPDEPLPENRVPAHPNFPSVCLIGLGRCGSNVALGVAALVHDARNYYLSEFDNEQRRIKARDPRPMKWIQRSLKLPHKQAVAPVYLLKGPLSRGPFFFLCLPSLQVALWSVLG